MTGPGPEPPARRGAVALLWWVAAMLIGAGLIARADYSADLSAFLPASPDARQRVLIEQLQSGVAARTLLIGIEGGDAAQRAQASAALAAALRASGAFEQVQNGAAGDWQAVGRFLFEHRYQLSPAVDAERFSSAGLREAIGATVALLGTPASALIKPLLESDPTGETQRIAESLIPAQAPRIEGGVWVSRHAPRALLFATTRAAGADLDGQAHAQAALQAAFDGLALPGLRLHASGPGVFAVQSRAQIESEVKRLAMLGTLAMGGLLLLAFASLRALALALLPVATGIVAGIAAVSLVFGSVHGITLGFGSTLIGEAVDYAIYYLIQARGGAPGSGWRHWREAHWPTVRLGLLTSVAGFAALAFSGFPGLAQLGVFSLAGLLGAALATRFVLPSLAPNGAQGQGLRRALARLAARAIDALARLRWPAVALGVAACAVLALPGTSLWRADLAALSPVPRAAQALDATLRADLGASDARTLVAAGGADVQTALRAAEAAAARLDGLVDRGVLAGYDTPTRLLPSIATQQARLAALPAAAALRERLAQASAGGPLPATRLAPFVDAVVAARGLAALTRDDLRGSALAPLVDALLFERRDGGWSALLALQAGAAEIDAAQVRAALQGLAVAGGDIQVVDIKHELDSLYRSYLNEAIVQVAIGALAVLLLLGFALRSARRLLAVCRPLLLAVLVVLAGAALAGASLGILHLVGLLLVVAVGSNYTLFFDQFQQRGEHDDDTLASLLLANLTTVVSFGLLAGSDIPALSAIGRVVAPGALLALLFAAAFARPAAAAR